MDHTRLGSIAAIEPCVHDGTAGMRHALLAQRIDSNTGISEVTHALHQHKAADNGRQGCDLSAHNVTALGEPSLDIAAF